MSYSAAFEVALAFVLGVEGGYANVAGDTGGPTMAGVTQGAYDEYRRLLGLPTRPVRQSTPQDRKDLYHVLFWQRGRCDLLTPPAATIHFDGCVNHGCGTATMLVQALVGARPIDGGFGPITLAAALRMDPRLLAGKLATARRGFYVGLLVTNPKDADAKFINGWLARMASAELLL